MSLSDLFLKETRGFSESLVKLPQDMDLWAEKIITIIKQKIPESKNLKVSVHFLKTNEELGIATGAVTLFDKKVNKRVFLPIVVNNFTMYPLDIMMIGNEKIDGDFDIVPFDLETFREELENSSPFNDLARPMDRLKQMYMNPSNQVIYPPTYRNVYAAAEGTMLSAIDGTVDKEDVDDMKESVKKDRKSLKGYEENSNLGLVSKSINMKEKNADDDDDDLSEGGEDKIKVAMIRKIGSGLAEVITVGSVAFQPTKEVVKLTEGAVSENDRVTFKADLDPETFGKVCVIDPVGVRNTKIMNSSNMSSSFAGANVTDMKGISHGGVIVKTTIDLVSNKSLGSTFLNEQVYSQASTISMTLNEDPSIVEKSLRFVSISSAMREGNKIVLCASYFTDTPADTQVVMSNVVTVQTVSSTNSNYKAFCVDSMGRRLIINAYNDCDSHSVSTTPQRKSLSDIFGSRSNATKVPEIYTSDTIKVAIVHKEISLTDMMVKAASVNFDANQVRVISTGKDSFALKGADIVKMANAMEWDPSHLQVEEASFLLASKNCPMDKIASALRIAGSYRRESIVQGLTKVSFETPRVEVNEDLTIKKAEAAGKLKCNLFKEASNLMDSQVVDSVLSLNFINSKNLSKFMNFIPLLKQSVSAIARLVLASRLGVEEIPKNETVAAMNGVMSVIKGLEKLKGLNEKNASVKVASIVEKSKPDSGRVSILDFL